MTTRTNPGTPRTNPPTRTRTLAAVFGTMACLLVMTGCTDKETDMADASKPTTTTAAASTTTQGLLAADIPVAHTPPGGYGAKFPEPVLAGCTEPLVSGAPDLRGVWKAIAAEENGAPMPADSKIYQHVQRVEQCGNRLVVTGGGVIHDMRVDGTEANGVHDVLESDYKTPIVVVATYENGVHVLRPVGVPVEVTRHREGANMVWNYLGKKVTLERVGGPEFQPPAA